MDFINKQSEHIKAARKRQEDKYQSYVKQLDDQEAVIKKRYESFDEKVPYATSLATLVLPAMIYLQLMQAVSSLQLDVINYVRLRVVH